MNKLQGFVRENSTLILAGTGVLGFIVASVLTAKAAVKVKEYQDNLEEEMEPKEKATLLARAYAPSVGMILLSTAMIVASTRMQQRRYAALMALYTISESTLVRWRDAVETELPKKTAAKVRSKVFEPRAVDGELVIIGDGVLFYDIDHGRYFRAPSIEWVRARVHDATDFMNGEGFVSVNELYDYLGLPSVEGGDINGYMSEDGPIIPQLDPGMLDDELCSILSFDRMPGEWRMH